MTRFAPGSLLILATLTFGSPALAAGPAAPVTLDQIDLTAQETSFEGPQHLYRVQGKVHVVVRDLDVRCEQADIHLSDDDSRVLRLECSGNVVARRGKNLFRSARVTYWVPERRLLAQGGTRTVITLPAASKSVR